MSKMNRWIVGLTILTLLAVGGVALAGGGFGSRSAATCPAAGDSAVCTTDSELCPQDGTGCEEGAGACLGLLADRPLDGSGAQCAGGQGQRVGGCQGGRF
ncbi:hypothetical protein IH601_04230 [Candidatus Bipolaricaulota bacterium]|nr:hypothetical protein [Candidatus Bipolaricaulota bacterium]